MTNNRFINAFVGAAATMIFSFTFLSPVIGGAVAAWLEEGGTSVSVRIGTLSGILALIPVIIVLSGLVIAEVIPSGLGGLSIGGAIVYVIVLSAIGGYLGHYLMQDPRIPGAPTS